MKDPYRFPKSYETHCIVVWPVKWGNWLLLHREHLTPWTLCDRHGSSQDGRSHCPGPSLSESACPECDHTPHTLASVPCRRWLLTGPFKNAFSVRVHLKQAHFSAQEARCIFLCSWLCGPHCHAPRMCPLALFSICLELLLHLGTWVVFVKKKGSCWKLYCPGLGSKICPLYTSSKEWGVLGCDRDVWLLA